MNPNSDQKPFSAQTRRVAGGVILILAGIFFLLAHWLDIGMYFILLLGVGMLAWGTISRTVGWIIPGGVLGGIGLGIFAMEGPWHLSTLGAEKSGGVFLLCFALGWFLIALLSRLAGACTGMWWPLIPGGIMALVGGLLLLGGEWLKLLELSQYIWPAALIIAGLYLVVRWSRPKANQ